MVIEVHEAARELIAAAGADNLRAAYGVLDELVLEIKQANATANDRDTPVVRSTR